MFAVYCHILFELANVNVNGYNPGLRYVLLTTNEDLYVE
jgi:hypothetical protein